MLDFPDEFIVRIGIDHIIESVKKREENIERIARHSHTDYERAYEVFSYYKNRLIEDGLLTTCEDYVNKYNDSQLKLVAYSQYYRMQTFMTSKAWTNMEYW